MRLAILLNTFREDLIHILKFQANVAAIHCVRLEVQGSPTVRYGEYLFRRPKSPEILGFKTRDFLAKLHLGLSLQEDLTMKT